MPVRSRSPVHPQRTQFLAQRGEIPHDHGAGRGVECEMLAVAAEGERRRTHVAGKCGHEKTCEFGEVWRAMEDDFVARDTRREAAIPAHGEGSIFPYISVIDLPIGDAQLDVGPAQPGCNLEPKVDFFSGSFFRVALFQNVLGDQMLAVVAERGAMPQKPPALTCISARLESP